MPRLILPDDGAARVVQPFENVPFKVEMKRLSDEENNAILDRYGVIPGGGPKNTNKKMYSATLEMIRRQIVRWEGEEKVFGAPLPCTDDNKVKLLDMAVEDTENGEEVRKNLWSVCLAKYDAARSVELKN